MTKVEFLVQLCGGVFSERPSGNKTKAGSGKKIWKMGNDIYGNTD
jgi:hypothetical protein